MFPCRNAGRNGGSIRPMLRLIVSLVFLLLSAVNERNAEKDSSVVREFTIITGRGKHSRQAFQPVLRPAAQDMLLEEFDPPIPTRFDPTNDGRLQVQTSVSIDRHGRDRRRETDSSLLQRGFLVPSTLCRLLPSERCCCCVHRSFVFHESQPQALTKLALFLILSCIRLQVRKEDILKWCVKESDRGKRAPAPADNVGSLKLRGMVDLKAAYDRAVSEATKATAVAGEGEGEEAREDDDSWSGVGWTRNANESELV